MDTSAIAGGMAFALVLAGLALAAAPLIIGAVRGIQNGAMSCVLILLGLAVLLLIGGTALLPIAGLLVTPVAAVGWTVALVVASLAPGNHAAHQHGELVAALARLAPAPTVATTTAQQQETARNAAIASWKTERPAPASDSKIVPFGALDLGARFSIQYLGEVYEKIEAHTYRR